MPDLEAADVYLRPPRYLGDWPQAPLVIVDEEGHGVLTPDLEYIGYDRQPRYAKTLMAGRAGTRSL